MKSPEKRRRVMQRSMRLGHCICNPRQACPCELFHQQDICLCAGEAMPVPAGEVRLTELAAAAGCASKIDQAALERILAGLPAPADRRVLIGMAAGDDAGVFLLDQRTALVQTVDVFTPPVDDPFLFGQIAAANSLSDVYAMGGRPLTALSVVGFPVGKLPDDVLRQILRGGLDKMAEAGVSVIGGHSIKDDEIKAGFAVTGLIDPQAIMTNAGVRPGDRLVLTKPLGTGILALAARIGRADPQGVAAAARSMAALNRRAAELMPEFDAHACTDVTGFGLMGHLKSMAAASRVDVELVWDDLPLLPGVLEAAAQGILPARRGAEPRIVRRRALCGGWRRSGRNRNSLRRPDLGRAAGRGTRSGRGRLCEAAARRGRRRRRRHRAALAEGEGAFWSAAPAAARCPRSW